MDPIPPRFDGEFLRWLREKTEAAWRDSPADWEWPRNARWTGPLTDAEIAGAEQRHGLRFTDDYRLFLSTLHTLDRPMVRTEHDGSVSSYLGFKDWRDPPSIERSLSWLPQEAPRLTPIFGHRYQYTGCGDPVLSVYGDDVIVYGSDLRFYLLAELRDVLGIPEQQQPFDAHAIAQIPYWGTLILED